MSDQTPNQNLHLPSLVIKNFRGIDELTIPRLGRVTLLTGKNGVGKTALLDAVHVYADLGSSDALIDVMYSREEVLSPGNGSDVDLVTTNWDGLFFGRPNYPVEPIKIGPLNGTDSVQIRFILLDEGELPDLPPIEMMLSDGGKERVLEVTLGDVRRTLLHRRFPITPGTLPKHHDETYPPRIVCELLGPDVPNNAIFEQYLDDLALTPGEARAIQAFNIVVDTPVERVAMVGTGTRSSSRTPRRVIVKVSGLENPVPLRSLGDGASRAFAVALALAKSTDGFLLIDEAENGIHHSIQAKFWNMVLQTAERNNVQVIATTHSWDCVAGFAKAANELEDVEGVLYRIQRNGDRLRAVEYPEETLRAAVKHRIEVR